MLPPTEVTLAKGPQYGPGLFGAQIVSDGKDLLLVYGIEKASLQSDLRLMRFRVAGL